LPRPLGAPHGGRPAFQAYPEADLPHMGRRTSLNARKLISLLPVKWQQSLKAILRTARKRVYKSLFAYAPAQLEKELRALGLESGSAVIMHSSFSSLNGFSGEASDVLDRLMTILGPQGHLLMVSMAYSGSARDYLQSGAAFDVRRTPSQMGFLTEVFRRRKGVVRSANPMHPILAWGPRAAWVIDGHENLHYSCGPGSPFERMLELDAKALLFDVDLDVLTFTHYLEHTFQDSAPAEVYSAEPIETQIVDRAGVHRSVSVYPFSPDASKLRNFGVLYDDVIEQGLVRRARVGNTTLQVVALRDILARCAALVERGGHLFARPGEPTRVKPLRKKTLRGRLTGR
jgi:aminoglycoside 3-N-acetyltransferase